MKSMSVFLEAYPVLIILGFEFAFKRFTGISSEIRTKLRDWAVWQARAGCYSQAALSSNDSKTLYSYFVQKNPWYYSVFESFEHNAA